MSVSKRIRKRECTEFTIWEVFDIYKVEKIAYGLSTSTIQSYYESVQRLTSFLQVDNPLLKDFEKNDILEFIFGLQEENVRISSINHYLRDLRAFFNWSYKEGYLNHKMEIKLIKAQEVIKETYSEEELRKLLIPPITSNYCEWRSWAVVNWILATGNRERTVCHVRMCDIDLQEKEIILQQTKNKKIQIIPMSSELCHVLKQFIRDFRSDAKDKDYLFCNVSGERLTENALKLSIRDYNKSREVDRTSIHAFRHTFAKHWIRNNGDVFRLQKMLGHSSLDMTRNYVNMFSSDLKEGFDNFNPLDKMVKRSGFKHKIKKNH